MEKKEFTDKHIRKIQHTLSGRNYLLNEEVKNLSEKFGFCIMTMQRELLDKGIPFKAGKAGLALRSIGIITDGKNIDFSVVHNMESWELDFIKGTKLKIHYECKNCGEKSGSRAVSMFSRAYFVGEPICALCILKMATNSESWKENNSRAQLIAQNKPEQKEKNRQAQLRALENTDVIKKRSEGAKKKWAEPEYRKKMTEIARNKWKNPEYAEKVIKNSGGNFLCGYYEGIYYDSGYELAYLIKMENEGMLGRVRRAKFYISYKDKNLVSRCYYPDFIFDDTFIIEVKGYSPWQDTFENLAFKNKAADDWCRNNNMKFRIVGISDIGNHWYGKARKYHKESNDKVKKKNCSKV